MKTRIKRTRTEMDYWIWTLLRGVFAIGLVIFAISVLIMIVFGQGQD
jgi:hypothetical protein